MAKVSFCVDVSLFIHIEIKQIGVKLPAEISDANLEEFDTFMNINTRGTFLFTKAVSQVMKAQSSRAIQGRNGLRDLGRGVIVNIGSCNSYVAVGGIVQYTTSKHAVMGIVKSAGRNTLLAESFL